jgi:hypothetical protein
MPRLLFILPALPLLLAGCISFSSSETPVPVYQDACLNKEAQCREICADKGVQAFSCSARPGEGVELKCECRRAP